MAGDKSTAEISPFTLNKRYKSGGGVRRTTSRSLKSEQQGLRKVFKVARAGTAGLMALAAVRGGVALKGDVEQAIDKATTGVHRILGDKQPSAQTEIVDKRISAEFELIYPGLEGQEKWDAFVNYLAEQKVVQDDYIGPNHVENFKAVQELEPKIRQYAKEFGVPENLLIGLVIVESKGKQLAVNNDSGAKGLTQITDVMAKAHNLKISGADTKDPNYDVMADLADDRFNADLNLLVAAKEIANAYKYWGDWGLAFDEWHAGRPNVYLKIQLYVQSTQGVLLPNIEDATGEAESVAVKAQYLQRMGESVNLFRIDTNEAVVSEFSGKGYDYNLIYVPRLLAAGVYFEKNLDQIR